MDLSHAHMTRQQLERMFKAPYRELVRRYYYNAWRRQALWFWMEWPIPRVTYAGTRKHQHLATTRHTRSNARRQNNTLGAVDSY